MNRTHDFTIQCILCAAGIIAFAIIFLPRTLDSNIISYYGNMARCEWYITCVWRSIFSMWYIEADQFFKVAGFLTLSSIFGILTIMLSYQLDIIDDKPIFVSSEAGYIYLVIGYYCGSWILFAVMAGGGQGYGVFGIVILPFMLFFLTTFPFVSALLSISALPCVYRAVVMLTTSSKLREQVNAARSTVPLSGEAVADALDQKAHSPTHARAIRRDVAVALRESEVDLKRLKAEEERLSNALSEDVERRKMELALEQKLMEIETLKAKIAAHKRPR